MQPSSLQRLRIGAILAIFAAHFGASPGSIRGFLVASELGKSILTGLGFSSLAALGVAVLTSIAGDSAAIFPAPSTAAAMAFLAGHLADALRRLDHGATAEDEVHPAVAEFLSRPPGEPRYDHTKYGPYRFIDTPAGRSGPVFESAEAYRAWIGDGRPFLDGMKPTLSIRG